MGLWPSFCFVLLFCKFSEFSDDWAFANWNFHLSDWNWWDFKWIFGWTTIFGFLFSILEIALCDRAMDEFFVRNDLNLLDLLTLEKTRTSIDQSHNYSCFWSAKKIIREPGTKKQIRINWSEQKKSVEFQLQNYTTIRIRCFFSWNIRDNFFLLLNDSLDFLARIYSKKAPTKMLKNH